MLPLSQINSAPYVHRPQGRPFLCRRLDLGSRTALVRQADVKYYTRMRDYTDVHVTGKR